MTRPGPALLLAAAVLVAAVASVLAAGCGGGSSEPATTAEVQQEVVTARNRVDFAFQRMKRAESLDDLLDRMSEASDNIGDAASDLDDVNAPEPFTEEFDNLAAALEQLSVDLGATASDLENPEFLESFASGAQGISFESWEQANAALAALNELGIEVDQLERY
ncbi:MAG: hypothetical protein R6W48_07990 [Gaiellaceae bacterium]